MWEPGVNYKHQCNKEAIEIVSGVGKRETKTVLEARNNLLLACLIASNTCRDTLAIIC